jgi:hypothetical protein
VSLALARHPAFWFPLLVMAALVAAIHDFGAAS